MNDLGQFPQQPGERLQLRLGERRHERVEQQVAGGVIVRLGTLCFEQLPQNGAGVVREVLQALVLQRPHGAVTILDAGPRGKLAVTMIFSPRYNGGLRKMRRIPPSLA